MKRKGKDPIKVIANMVNFYCDRQQRDVHPGSKRWQELNARIESLNMARALIEGNEGTLTSMVYNDMLMRIGKSYFDFVQLKKMPGKRK